MAVPPSRRHGRDHGTGSKGGVDLIDFCSWHERLIVLPSRYAGGPLLDAPGGLHHIKGNAFVTLRRAAAAMARHAHLDASRPSTT